jgi:nitrous oxidase accessory protein NosD
MRRVALLALVIGFLAPFLILASAPAYAQATRTWVSGVGDDANPCSRTAPCKTFAGAISKTAAGGEIDCLDPGGFGGVTIVKSMTLNCHEVFGSILVAGSPGITVNASGALVVLRGLQITGVTGTATPGTIGIRILAAATVSIEDCVVTQFSQQGISDTRTTGGTKLFIRNSVVSNNTGTGIAFAATGNSAEIENTSSINNLFGLAVGSGTLAMVRRSVFSGNGTGIEADPGAGINIDNSAISNNTTGVVGTSNIRVSNSDVTFNATGFSGTTVSYGNNRFQGNTAFGTALGSAALQ